MTFLATRGMHYVVNPKCAQLIGTVLFFAAKKAKRRVASDNMIQRVLLATFTRSPAPFLKVTKTQHNMIQQVLLATFTRSPVPFLKVTKTQHNKFCEPLSGIFALKKRTQN